MLTCFSDGMFPVSMKVVQIRPHFKKDIYYILITGQYSSCQLRVPRVFEK